MLAAASQQAYSVSSLLIPAETVSVSQAMLWRRRTVSSPLVTFQRRPHPCYHLVRSCRCGQGNIKSIFMPLFSHLEAAYIPASVFPSPMGASHQHGHNPFLAPSWAKRSPLRAANSRIPFPGFPAILRKPIPKILWDRFKPTVGKGNLVRGVSLRLCPLRPSQLSAS